MGLLHLWLGLLSSVVLCIVCITGCIYAFKNQIIDLYNYDKVFIKGTSHTVDIDGIQSHFSRQGKSLSSLFIPKDEGRTWVISYTDAQNISHSTYFDPYQKTELGVGDDGLDDFFQSVLGLHRNLLLGDVGRQIVGASVLIFLLLIFSGFVLWLPKKLKHLKQGLTVKLDSKPQRLNYDLHNVLGFYAMFLLIFIAITGIYVTYPWVKNGLITALGGTSIHETNIAKDTAQNDDFEKLMADMLARQDEKNTADEVLPLSQIITKTNEHLNYSGDLTIKLPNAENPRYAITKINSENWLTAMLPDEITFDKKGELKTKDIFLEKPLHKQFIALARPLHTGEIIGLPSIILYFIASLIGFILPITGFFIWWNRVKKQV